MHHEDEASKVPDCVQRISRSKSDSASSDIDDLQGVGALVA